eukprot:1392066-Pyramimonas_sp.AAC.1
MSNTPESKAGGGRSQGGGPSDFRSDYVSHSRNITSFYGSTCANNGEGALDAWYVRQTPGSPQNPTTSEEYQRRLQGVLYGTRGAQTKRPKR